MGIAYGFDPKTGEYLGEVYAQDSPLEPGHLLVPMYATLEAPPAHVEGKLRVFNSGAWQYQDIPQDPEPEPTPTTAERIAANIASIQSELDRRAQAKGYDNIVSACTYAAQPVGAPFQGEGTAFLMWRSAVWTHAYAVLADVESGNVPMPTREEAVTMMPALVLP